MSLFNETLLWLMKRRMPRIEEHFKNPLALQHSSLDELIFSGRNTEWGKKYGYSEIGNYEQFKAKVPISTYEEIFPYISQAHALAVEKFRGKTIDKPSSSGRKRSR